jgi:hypothetical protein
MSPVMGLPTVRSRKQEPTEIAPQKPALSAGVEPPPEAYFDAGDGVKIPPLPDNPWGTPERASGDDVIFVREMIGHHEAALEMAEMALSTTTSPRVRAMAESIIASQGGEIAELEEMLSSLQGGAPGMGGMPVKGVSGAYV